MIVNSAQLAALSTELGSAPARVLVQTAKAIHEGTRFGQERAQEIFRGQVRELYLPHYANSITAESAALVGEFGPDPSLPQGGMGTGIEFGSSNHGPIAHMGPAADDLERELPGDLLEVAADSVLFT